MATVSNNEVRMCTPVRSGSNSTVKLGFMRHSLLAPALLIGIAAGGVGCAGNPPQTPEPAPTSAPTDPAPAGDGLPADAAPAATEWVDCPYLQAQDVAGINGQRVLSQGIDPRFATPACQFWSYEDTPQATVLVRDLGTVEGARATVDWAAPVDATEPVSAADTGGWEGGRGIVEQAPGAPGPAPHAVYAVQKGPVAVVVWSDQEQTFKAQRLAETAIANLGL